jgi:crotonobetainyl-CoA:carnitine CoA-transferase CaiB-like acyl-CoA transferase
MPEALSGIRVLDFSRMYAGPFCSMILRELGAEVIKVEFRESGDACRTIPPITEGGEGYIFTILNRGKKSITLELREPEGRQLALDLIAKADILLENFTPGVMDKMGLGYKDVKKVNRRLIYASLSGFGHYGPYTRKPAFDMVAQAMGGLMSVTGFPENPPTKCGPAVGDLSGGLYTTISILAALQYKNTTGLGQHIDISLQDCVWALTSVETLAPYFLLKQPAERIGNMHPQLVPWNAYRASDGYIVICIVTIGQWRDMARLMKRPDLIEDPDSLPLVERVKKRTELDKVVAGWVAPMTVAEVQGLLEDAGLPCAPIMDTEKIVSDPHIQARQMVTEVEQMISGPIHVPGTVFKLSETPGNPNHPAPFLGEHNEEIYTALLGYSEEKIAELMGRDII